MRISTPPQFLYVVCCPPPSRLIHQFIFDIQSKLQEDSPNWIVTVAGLVHTSLLDLILAPVTTMLGYQSLMPLSPALCPWGIVRCSTAFFILHSKQTIVSMARNVHRWVQQSAHRPLSPTPSGPFRPPTRQLSSRVERQLLDLMTNEEVISLLERVSMK